jgi:hypothetical protein
MPTWRPVPVTKTDCKIVKRCSFYGLTFAEVRELARLAKLRKTSTAGVLCQLVRRELSTAKELR